MLRQAKLATKMQMKIGFEIKRFTKKDWRIDNQNSTPKPNHPQHFADDFAKWISETMKMVFENDFAKWILKILKMVFENFEDGFAKRF